MATKFKRVQQQRRQLAMGGSVFPPNFIAQLDAHRTNSGSPGTAAVASELQAFASIQSTFGELQDLRSVLSALQRAVCDDKADEADVRGACGLVAQLLFLRGASLLHKPVLASVRRLPPSARDAFGATVAEQLVQLASCAPRDPASPSTGADSSEAALGSLIVALVNEPLCLPWIRSCSVPAVQRLSLWVRSSLTTAAAGTQLPPPLMAELQNSISAIHHIVSQHGRYMCTAPGGTEAVALAAETMLEALQGDALMREALATAGVILYAAAILPDVPPAQALLGLAQGLFLAAQPDPGSAAMSGPLPPGARLRLAGDPGAGSTGSASADGVACSSGGGAGESGAAAQGVVGRVLRGAATSLPQEVQRLSTVGRVCALRGLLTAVPLDALCAPMVMLPAGGAAGRPWTFLLDGALAYSCSLVANTQDAHIKYHAAAAVCLTLEKLRSAWDLAAARGCLLTAARTASRGTAATTPTQLDVHDGTRAATADEDGAELCLELFYIEEEEEEAAAASACGARATMAGASDSGGGNSTAAVVSQAQVWQPPLLTPAERDSVMALLWANMDEPLAQTVRQVQDAFELLLEALAYQDHFIPLIPPRHAAQEHQQRGKHVQALSLDQFVEMVSARLVGMPASRKNRYQPLSAIARRFGAVRLLRLQPALLHQALASMQDSMVTNSATYMLGSVLEALRDECARNPVYAPESAADSDGCGGTGNALEAWQSWWLPAFVQALLSPSEKLRSCVSSRALPVLLGLEVRAALALLRAVLHPSAHGPPPGADAAPASLGSSSSSRVAAAVAVLRAARSLQLIGDLDALEGHKQALGVEPEQLLVGAAVHGSESLRMDVLELACYSPRFSEAPGRLELTVVSRWLVLNMRHTSVGPRAKCVVLLHKLLCRVRVAACAIVHRRVTRGGAAEFGRHPGGVRGGNITGMFELGADATQRTGEEEDEATADVRVLERMQSWMQWLTRLLLDCLYPGSPFERKYFAMQLINTVLDVFAVGDGWDSSGSGTGAAASGTPALPVKGRHKAKRAAAAASGSAAPVQRGPSRGGDQPLPASEFAALYSGFLSRHTVSLMMSGLSDGWDKIRQTSDEALSHLPVPLPSYETPAALLPLLRRACALLWSPRQRESDAGARMVRLFFNKYVLQLCWHITVHPELTIDSSSTSTCSNGSGSSNLFQAAYGFLDSVLMAIEEQVTLAQRDLLAACRDGLCHNALLLLRYVAEGVDWSSFSAVPEQAARLRGWLTRLVSQLALASALAMPAVSQPTLAGAGEVDAEEAGDIRDEEVGGEEAAGDEEGEGNSDSGALGPEAQVITTASWTTIKEVAFLIGTLAQRLPLPAAHGVSSPVHEPPAPAGPHDLLSIPQLQGLGRLLLEQLMYAKHNGAVQKSAVGLQALAERLLRSGDPQLNTLPAAWMAHIFKRLQLPGQGLDDIVRRSGGLPFAVNALLLSEPTNAPKILMPATMAALLAVATTESPLSTNVPPLAASLAAGVSDAAAAAATPSSDEGGASVAAPRFSLAVTAVPGDPWPRVHAFNCLRQAYHDTGLAVDCSASYATGIESCIRGMAAPSWEVRNAASLCFTVLIARVIGFKNLGRWEFSKKAVTGAEFFQRYPSLHGFLLSELRTGVMQLLGAAARGARGTGTGGGPGGGGVHPSLYPALIILSSVAGTGDESPEATPTASSRAPTVVKWGHHSTGVARAGALVRLRPSLQQLEGPPANVMAPADVITTPLSPAAFAPLVRDCAAARPAAIRALAANALGPLLTPQQLPCVLHQLLAGVPTLLAPDGAPLSVGGTHLPRVRDHNALHGTLLQLRSLMQGNVALLAPDTIAAVTALVLPHLQQAVWLAVPTSASSPPTSGPPDAPLTPRQRPAVPGAVRAAYFQLAAAALQLLTPWQCRQHAGAVQALQHACATSVAAVGMVEAGEDLQQLPISCGVDLPDVQLCLSLKAAVHLWLGPALTCEVLAKQMDGPAADGTGLGGADAMLTAPAALQLLAQRLDACLASRAYDVRAAATQHLKRFVGLLLQLQGGADAGRLDGGAAGPVDMKLLALGSEAVSERCAAPLRAWINAVSASLWRHSGHELCHKVVRRLLQALGHLHTLKARAGCGARPRPSAGSARGSGDAGSTDAGGSDKLWLRVEAARRLLAGAREPSAACEALRCLGRALGPIVEGHVQGLVWEDGQEDDRVSLAVRAVCTSIQRSAEAHQPHTLRLAALDALEGSNLTLVSLPLAIHQLQQIDPSLQKMVAGQPAVMATGQRQSTAMVAEQQQLVAAAEDLYAAALTAWREVLTLLEDEEATVREAAAALVQRAGTAVASIGSADGDPITSPIVADSVALCVEEAQRQAYGYVGVVLCSVNPFLRVEVVRLLLTEVWDPALPLSAGLQQALAVSATAATAGLTGLPPAARRKLFDREVDNRHEEPLLTAQLAAQQLKTLLDMGGAADAQQVTLSALCLSWCTRAVAQLSMLTAQRQPAPDTPAQPPPLHSMAGTSLSTVTDEGTSLATELLNHPEVYPSLCRVLLLFWAVPPTSCLAPLEAESGGGPQPQEQEQAARSPEAKAVWQLQQVRTSLWQAVSKLVRARPQGPLTRLLEEIGQPGGWLEGPTVTSTATAATAGGATHGTSHGNGAGAALFLLQDWLLTEARSL